MANALGQVFGGTPRAFAPTSVGSVPMHIFAHLGHDDKSYELAAARYSPDRCMACGGWVFGPHDGYERWGLNGRIVIRRYRCHSPGCRQVWSVLPSYLTRFQMYATAVESAAVLCYVLQGQTYKAVAEATGVSTTTVFRWVAEAAGVAAATWARVVHILLEFTPEQPVPEAQEAADQLRAGRWRQRRVRSDKIGRLLDLCVLVRCLEAFAQTMRPVWPAARHVPAWGLWRWADYPTRKWQTIRATNGGNSRASPGC